MTKSFFLGNKTIFQSLSKPQDAKPQDVFKQHHTREALPMRHPTPFSQLRRLQQPSFQRARNPPPLRMPAPPLALTKQRHRVFKQDVFKRQYALKPQDVTPSVNNVNNAHRKIPCNIIQTWCTKNTSTEFKSLSKTWITKNPHYSYFLYDDDECEKFIKKYFDDRVYSAYIRIIPGAFKADLFRYCFLYIYGGIYVDIDTICINPIDLFLNKDVEFITPIDLNTPMYIGTHNLFNAFIGSIPKHPILLDCINRVVYNVENDINPVSKLDFAGPGLLGRAVNKFLGNNETSTFIGKEGLHNDNKIRLLHFEIGCEYVYIDERCVLFQNKNGNEKIQKIYINELNRRPYIDWGSCNNIIRPLR